MAYPRVFISSTCYDLREIRDVLFSFIEEINYIPVLSDRGDVFYHPDIHTHESCLNEIETCQLFVLIIGGRFGGNYKSELNKSIVNAEYEAAKKLEIPIITFISRDVYEDHRVYQKNRKGNKIDYKSIEYPSIENQLFAINIFEFIDEVRKSEYNNAIFPFEFGREIRKYLKQQWAGMFYEFLRLRKINKQSEKTNNLLSDLALISEKTEDILNRVYKSVDKENSIKEIEKIDSIYDGKRFLFKIVSFFGGFLFPVKDIDKYTNFNQEYTLGEFLLSTGDFITMSQTSANNKQIKGIVTKDKIYGNVLRISGDLSRNDIVFFEKFQALFDSYKALPMTTRIDLIADISKDV